MLSLLSLDQDYVPLIGEAQKDSGRGLGGGQSWGAV